MTTTVSIATNQPMSFLSQTKEMMESGSGIFITQKFAAEAFGLIEQILKQLGHCGERCKEISDIFFKGAIGITIPYAVTSTIDAGQTTVDLAKKNFSCTRGVGLEWAQKISVSIQMLAYSACLFTQKAVYQFTGDFFNFVEDSLDVAIMGDRLCDVSNQKIETLPKDMQTYLHESKKLYWIKLAKAVLAATAGVLGVLGCVLGYALVPAILLLSISVTGSALEIFSRYYKMNMSYKLNAP
jgi:hypothetical protein